VTLSIHDLREWDERHHGPFDSELAADIGEINLGAIVRGEAPETQLGVLHRNDGQGLFYLPGINDIHGEPGTGKSLVTQAAIAVYCATAEELSASTTRAQRERSSTDCVCSESTTP
jgi:hypothetical protein